MNQLPAQIVAADYRKIAKAELKAELKIETTLLNKMNRAVETLADRLAKAEDNNMVRCTAASMEKEIAAMKIYRAALEARQDVEKNIVEINIRLRLLNQGK